MGFYETNKYVGDATRSFERKYFGDILSSNVGLKEAAVCGLALIAIGCSKDKPKLSQYKFINPPIIQPALDVKTTDLSYKGNITFKPDTTGKDLTSRVEFDLIKGKVVLTESPDSNRVIEYHAILDENGKLVIDSVKVSNPQGSTTYRPDDRIGQDVVSAAAARLEKLLETIEAVKRQEAAKVLK